MFSRCVAFVVALALAASCGRRERADPAELFTTSSVGLTFLNRGQLPEAETQFKKLIALAPDDPAGHANLGLTYLRGGRFDAAEKELRRARKLDSANTDVALTLARLYTLTGRRGEARQLLESRRLPEGGRGGGADNARVLFALAELESGDSATGPSANYERRLRELVASAPTNLAARLKLARAFVQLGQADSAARILEEFRALRPEPPAESRPLLRQSIELLRAGKVAEARPSFERFAHLLELSQPYQTAWEEIEWTSGPTAGRPVLTFEPQSKIKMLGVVATPASADSLIFQDITADAPFGSRATAGGEAAAAGAAPSVIVLGDFDNDDSDDLLASFASASNATGATRLYRAQGGEFADVTTLWSFPLRARAIAGAAGDADNDGWLDLFVVTTDGLGHLLRNSQNGRFTDATAQSGIGDVGRVRKAVFVDVDHDGDLDLLTVGGTTRVYRNNADGSFTEVAQALGLTTTSPATDVAFADLDDDGRIDLVFATASGVMVMRNTGTSGRRFEDVTATSGIAAGGATSAVDVGDYDNDGLFDVVVLPAGGRPTLWRNTGRGGFTADHRSDAALPRQAQSDSPGTGAALDGDLQLLDVDNDGWLDLLVVAAASPARAPGVTLLRNDAAGRFTRSPRALPGTVTSGSLIVANDIDGDGDMDVFVGDANGGGGAAFTCCGTG